ncbi:IMPACT family protein [Spiroplasma platyhelix]|uniref:Impact N-terminal domain-containing protein n=1 Tax=Spiroplasma platyhelix PALS-1 TaxID=1276218 RepID=A0A846U997_9MOLU|nr:YigZ family protein [Spiroplasma platyhelix]MBE4704083.1 hypothetical protein [Spiroplasma platyhelix PALS-1]NKE38453.1 hypothetical protein [Spiroplasma platyhelix PALS-1]UJB29341.1 hypothetical protein SPLAT_v1c05770 [Spiroplasma platyhelix PALS-1]
MKTVAQKLWSKSYTIKNSKFEVSINQITNVAEAETFLQEHQDQKATHNCYAYIVGFPEQIKRFNDDGEPNKSAGFAILKILEEKQLTNIIVLVRRYFQPPKLGVGHLMRGYQQGLLNYLAVAKLLAIVPSKEYQIVVPVALINLIYQWQKIYHFLILKQTSDDLKVTFIINLAKEKDTLPYHSEVDVTYLKDSFLISAN